MPILTPQYAENRRKYLQNRRNFPLDELANYAGKWIAWSPDGTRIVASADDVDELEALVVAAGEDVMQCLREPIPAHDSLIGGAFLGGESCD